MATYILVAFLISGNAANVYMVDKGLSQAECEAAISIADSIEASGIILVCDPEGTDV